MRHCYVLRVFTREEKGGNHLGVVTDVTGIDDAGMQRVALENGFSETVFIDWRDEGIPRVRIFTPGRELPFAGHPLVGAAWVLGMIGPGTVDRMMCGVGEIPFRMEGDVVWVDTPMVEAVRTAPEADDIAAAAGLATPVGAWWVDMPLPYLVADLGFPDAVADARPDLEALMSHGADMCYLFAQTKGGYKARFFAPRDRIAEDPATGSAAAALAAVRRHIGEGSGSSTVFQGDEMAAPSTIRLQWDERYASLGGTVRRDEVRVLEI
ncbi:MAG TPA: PhzF family phenazine biosynthesis isomerase [Acidimicrobiia bacterium]|nr:PhzF family phenazine biosynthesis isomerase [Acidimicrobiia bacterium]